MTTWNIISTGQLSLATTLAFACFIVCFLKLEKRGCALCLTILLQLKFPYFIPLILYFAGCRQWRTVLLTALYSLLYMAVAFCVLSDPAIWKDYLLTVQHFNSGLGNVDTYTGNMINLKGALKNLGGSARMELHNSIAQLCYVMLCACAFFWPWITRKQADATGIVFWITAGLFLSPYTPVTDSLLLLPVAVVATGLMHRVGPIRWLFIVYMLGIANSIWSKVFIELLLIALIGYLTWHERARLSSLKTAL